MMNRKRKIYIFNETSRASVYGIGTDIEQLVDSLKHAHIDFEVIHLYSEGKEVTMIEKNGYRQISIPTVSSFSVVGSSQYYIRNVAYLLKDLIPDNRNVQYIFHLNFMKNHSLVPALKKMFKCKVITTVHYTSWLFSLSGNERRLKFILSDDKTKSLKFEKHIKKEINEDKRMLKRSDRFICVAQHTLNSFKNVCDIDVTNGLVITNALKDVYKKKTSEQKNAIRNKYFISEHTKIVMFAGRLDETKGLSVLMDAFKKTIKTNPDTHLFIAGDGDFNKWLSISNYHWTKITFTGRLNKKQLYELYCIANVGVMCSLYEEFGYVAIEMMMHEIPLVVTDTGGLSEIVEDGICGFKIPVRNLKDRRTISVNRIADKIKILLDNPDLATQLGNNGRKRFLEKYELNLFIDKMVDLYMNV